MFFAFEKLHLPINISLCFYIFSKPPLGTVFRGSMCRSFITNLILVPFSIFGVFQTGTFGATCSFKVVSKSTSISWAGRPCRDPDFHETIVITMPFGPNGFSKVVFGSRLTHVQVFSVFLCAISYLAFLSPFFIITQ